MTESEALREWRLAMDAFVKAKARLKAATDKLHEPPRNDDGLSTYAAKAGD